MGIPIATLIGTAAGAYFGGPMGAAAGATVGSMIDGSQAQSAADDRNVSLNQENRNWQYSMSSTAFQRATADLKAAGLNPLLAAGAQASTPSGSVADVKGTAESIQSGARGLVEAASMAQQAKKQESEIGLLNAQIKQSDAMTKKTAVDAAVAAKGIPEAELKNDVYDVIRPMVQKTKQIMQQSAKPPITRQTPNWRQKVDQETKQNYRDDLIERQKRGMMP